MIVPLGYILHLLALDGLYDLLQGHVLPAAYHHYRDHTDEHHHAPQHPGPDGQQLGFCEGHLPVSSYVVLVGVGG